MYSIQETSISKFATISFRSFPHEHMILSSTRLSISKLDLMRNKSLMNMLKSKGPRTDPCGIPSLVLFAVLLSDPIFNV